MGELAFISRLSDADLSKVVGVLFVGIVLLGSAWFLRQFDSRTAKVCRAVCSSGLVFLFSLLSCPPELTWLAILIGVLYLVAELPSRKGEGTVGDKKAGG